MGKNGELQIEKGIPVPPGTSSKGHTEILRKLGKGDSVVLPVRTPAANAKAAYVLGKGNYAARKVDDDHTRVWRIK